MSSGLVIEPFPTGCTSITYYAANNNKVKHECDLGWLVTQRREKQEEVSLISMNYDWTGIQNKVHNSLLQDRMNISAQTDIRYGHS